MSISLSRMHARTARRAPALGKKRVLPGTRSMWMPRSAWAASNDAAAGSDDAVSTT